MRHQQFAFTRLSHPHMTWSNPRLLTETFTTAAFDRSSFRQFGTSPYRATPKGPPSSSAQHGAIRTFLTQRLRFTGRLRLTCTFPQPWKRGHFYFAGKGDISTLPRQSCGISKQNYTESGTIPAPRVACRHRYRAGTMASQYRAPGSDALTIGRPFPSPRRHPSPAR